MDSRDHRQQQRVDRQIRQSRLRPQAPQQVIGAFFGRHTDTLVLGSAAHDLVGEIPVVNELAYLLDGKGAHFENVDARKRITPVPEGSRSE